MSRLGTQVRLTARPVLSRTGLNVSRAPQLAQRALSTSRPTQQGGYRRWGDVPRLEGQGTGQYSRFRPPPTFVVVLLGGAGVYYVFHLEQVEGTGRWRFMDTSPETEKQLGVQSYREIMSQYQHAILPSSNPTAQYVQKVARRIIQANGLDKDTEWTTHVVADDRTKNAFVLPGGNIFVFTGILPICRNEDGLAVVLGHEIAHQVARHSAERYSSVKVLMALGFLLESMGLDVGISRLLLNLIMTLPNSRKSENEADLIGLRLSNKACYDPREAEDLWRRMSASEGGSGNLDFLSTHPNSHKREVALKDQAVQLLTSRPDYCGPLKDHYDDFTSAFRRQ